MDKQEAQADVDRRRELNRARTKRWRERHPSGGAEASRKRRAANPGYAWPAKERLQDEVRALKCGPCADCGQRFHWVCMDFDHVRGEKSNNVGTMVAHGWNREKVFDEVAKCDLVCSNCHRVRTYDRHIAAAVHSLPEDSAT